MRQGFVAARLAGKPCRRFPCRHSGNNISVLVQNGKATLQIERSGKARIFQGQRNIQVFPAGKIAVQRDVQRTQAIAKVVVDEFKGRALQRLAVFV